MQSLAAVLLLTCPAVASPYRELVDLDVGPRGHLWAHSGAVLFTTAPEPLAWREVAGLPQEMDGGFAGLAVDGADAVLLWTGTGQWMRWRCEAEVYERVKELHGRFLATDVLRKGATWLAYGARVRHEVREDDPPGVKPRVVHEALGVVVSEDAGCTWTPCDVEALTREAAATTEREAFLGAAWDGGELVLILRSGRLVRASLVVVAPEDDPGGASTYALEPLRSVPVDPPRHAVDLAVGGQGLRLLTFTGHPAQLSSLHRSDDGGTSWRVDDRYAGRLHRRFVRTSADGRSIELVDRTLFAWGSEGPRAIATLPERPQIAGLDREGRFIAVLPSRGLWAHGASRPR